MLKTKTTYVVALIYVDDVLLIGYDTKKIQEVKSNLQKYFSIKDLSPLKYFLGNEVARCLEGFVISQRKYTLYILEDCRLQDSCPSTFPMEQNLRLAKEDSTPEVDDSKYRCLVGRLIYLTITRHDISFSVNPLTNLSLVHVILIWKQLSMYFAI